jgi:DNA-directed RNA polymerase specialized sigma24 family protein
VPGVTDKAVGEYRGLVEALATEVHRSPGAKRVGAEFDDLVQEGLICVWQSLERGHNPAHVIKNRMKDWVKFLAHRGTLAYATFLPLEDFRDLARQD